MMGETVRTREVAGGLATLPEAPEAMLVLAHGAGAGMRHAFMELLAGALGRVGIATWRWEFPYMRDGRRRPDRPSVALPAVRAAVEEARRRWPKLPLFAGGKSFGGRMTSTAAAEAPLPVEGLVFFGFPLHPARRPGVERAAHLRNVQHPLLFLQGDRDALAELALLRTVVAELGERAHLHVVEGADHAFRVLKRSGRRDEEIPGELAGAAAAWMLRPPPLEPPSADAG
jgi:predicted alpha/beta-hydrolase family hydrolase